MYKLVIEIKIYFDVKRRELTEWLVRLKIENKFQEEGGIGRRRYFSLCK